MSTQAWPNLAPGAAALLVGTFATWLVRTFARRFGIVNKPNPIVPQHTRPVAYLGGVGLGLGVACGVLILLAWFRPDFDAIGLPWAGVWIPAALYLALGVYDDLVALPPARKFLFQAAVAALAVALGQWSPVFGVPVIDRVVCWFWIVTLVNAFNLTDVCDGLLGSLSAVTFLFFALAFHALTPLCVVLIASCCGFLVFNRPPATIFMGDAGSHLLGALAATLTIAGARAGSIDPFPTVLVSVLLVGVPLFELAFLVVVRTRKGLAWWRGSPDHFSLRMQAGGFTRFQTDAIACGFAALFGVGALGVQRSGLTGRLAIVAGAALASALAARQLLKWEVKRPPRPGTAAAPAASTATGDQPHPV
ncbi:MAG: hypothetical protein GC200_04150 [Tepidisphaera sp.]|nr:hypothetical protein [Tepidisphaera sp.]